MKLLPSYIKTEAIRDFTYQQLQDPKKMMIAVILGMGIAGLVFIGIPMRASLISLEEELAEETKRQEIILNIQKMKSINRIYQKRLNKNGSFNWWIEYILNGSREFNLKIQEFKPNIPRTPESRPGTYQGMLLEFKITGTYDNLSKFTRWIEGNKWSMRITRLYFKKETNTDLIQANINIAILVSRTAKATAASEMKSGPAAIANKSMKMEN